MAGTDESQGPIDAANPKHPEHPKDAKEAGAMETAEDVEDEEELEDLGVPGEVQQDVEGGDRGHRGQGVDRGHRPAAWWGSNL